MPTVAVLLLLLLPLSFCAPVSLDEAEQYLQDFGYIEPASISASGTAEDEATLNRNSLKRFQAAAGLEKTGEFDRATLEKMASPRCGIPDLGSDEDPERKFDTNVITYSIEREGSSIAEAHIRNAARAAFAAYEAVTPLKFKEVDLGKGDIKLNFTRGKHDCLARFDGKGKILAHVFFGKIHFDDDEHWAVMNPRNTIVTEKSRDLLTVAMHEIGHVLGLGHTIDDHLSLMAPFYIAPVDEDGDYLAPKLSEETVKTLQRMYGKPEKGNCLSDVNAGFNLPDGRIMMFPKNGSRVLEFDAETKELEMNEHISKIFVDGPESVSAAYFNDEDSTMMLFSGNHVWRYDYDETRDKVTFADGYPKKLRSVSNEWRTVAALYSTKKIILVNHDKSIGFYNEASGSVRLPDRRIDSYYQNMPEDVIGFVKIEGHTRGITHSDFFAYDFRANIFTDIGPISEFLDC